MPKDESALCDGCGVPLKPEDAYLHLTRLLCARCCMASRMPRTRKSHWQYISSVKADYLRDTGKE